MRACIAALAIWLLPATTIVAFSDCPLRENHFAAHLISLDIVNLLTALPARAHNDPDKAFDKIVDKVRSNIDGVTLRESDEALLDSIRRLMRFTAGTEGR